MSSSFLCASADVYELVGIFPARPAAATGSSPEARPFFLRVANLATLGDQPKRKLAPE